VPGPQSSIISSAMASMAPLLSVTSTKGAKSPTKAAKEPTIEKSGWLNKRGVLNSRMKRRWIVLEGHTLSWYAERKTAESGGEALGDVELQDAKVTVYNSSDGTSASSPSSSNTGRFPFAIETQEATARYRRNSVAQALQAASTGSARKLELEAESEEERHGWVDAIRAAAAS